MTTIDVVSIIKMASWILNNIGSGNGLLPNGTQPSLKPMLMFFNWTIGNKVGAYLKQNRKILVGENVFENVVSKMVVYLLWHQCVDKELHLCPTHFYSITRKWLSHATDVVMPVSSNWSCWPKIRHSVFVSRILFLYPSRMVHVH